jgi:N-acetylglutamate synthase-like GNAT family acetyltransferase
MMAPSGQTGQTGTRALRPDDLDAVIDIDRRITGRARRGFFEKRLEAATGGTENFIVIAAEDGGKLTGYAIARIQAGEFDDAEPVAILDSIGIDPDCQRAGLGAKLLDAVTRTMKRLGIKELRTQTAWTDHALVRFFAANGFAMSPRIVLERSTARPIEG